MSAKNHLQMVVMLLLLAMFSEGLFAQSRKRVTLTAPPTIGRGVTGSFEDFRAYSAGMGNLAQSRPGEKGALSSSIGRTGITSGARYGRRLKRLRQANRSLSQGNTLNFNTPRNYNPATTPPNLPRGGRINSNISTRRNLQPGKGRPNPLGTETLVPLPIVTRPNYTNLNMVLVNPALLPTTPTSSQLALHSGRSYIASLNLSEESPLEPAQQQDIRTLVPDTPSRYQELMQKGENAFKDGNLREAAVSFELANELSLRSVESLLHLMHTHFATSTGAYGMTAYYLQEVLKVLPELPLVRVLPKVFYGDSSNFLRDLIELEKYVKKNDQDSSALFVLGYMKWREGDLEAARIALSQALEFSRGDVQSEAIRTLWDGMVSSGKISGELVAVEKPTPKTAPAKDDSDQEKATLAR